MYINKNSLIVDGLNLGTYITQAKYGFNKIWSSNSGRNLAGTFNGTLTGIYPKITVSFKKLSKEDLEIISPIIDSQEQTLQYYDPNFKKMVTLQTYTDSYEYLDKNIIRDRIKNESFEVAFISRKKREK